MARVSVSDTGIGVPRAEQERVFDRFYRLDKSRNRHSGGSGLGLSIALWVARSHGGDIQIESETGQGSIFRVLLPFAPERSPQ